MFEDRWGEGRGERGSNLVETALVLVLLLLLLAGVADFGRAFHSYTVITNAAREGARYASRFPSDQTGIEDTAIREAADSNVALERADITIIGLGGAAGNAIEVQVEYRISTFLGGIIGLGELPMRSATEMVVFGLDT